MSEKIEKTIEKAKEIEKLVEILPLKQVVLENIQSTVTSKLNNLVNSKQYQERDEVILSELMSQYMTEYMIEVTKRWWDTEPSWRSLEEEVDLFCDSHLPSDMKKDFKQMFLKIFLARVLNTKPSTLSISLKKSGKNLQEEGRIRKLFSNRIQDYYLDQSFRSNEKIQKILQQNQGYSRNYQFVLKTTNKNKGNQKVAELIKKQWGEPTIEEEDQQIFLPNFFTVPDALTQSDEYINITEIADDRYIRSFNKRLKKGDGLNREFLLTILQRHKLALINEANELLGFLKQEKNDFAANIHNMDPPEPIKNKYRSAFQTGLFPFELFSKVLFSKGEDRIQLKQLKVDFNNRYDENSLNLLNGIIPLYIDLALLYKKGDERLLESLDGEDFLKATDFKTIDFPILNQAIEKQNDIKRLFFSIMLSIILKLLNRGYQKLVRIDEIFKNDQDRNGRDVEFILKRYNFILKDTTRLPLEFFFIRYLRWYRKPQINSITDWNNIFEEIFGKKYKEWLSPVSRLLIIQGYNSIQSGEYDYEKVFRKIDPLIEYQQKFYDTFKDQTSISFKEKEIFAFCGFTMDGEILTWTEPSTKKILRKSENDDSIDPFQYLREDFLNVFPLENDQNTSNIQSSPNYPSFFQTQGLFGYLSKFVQSSSAF